ncbi:hypothetical protein [Mycolicibacterium stellerae]|uniref:hypothetical protein n=1 Tax=Mycolicibacterium stellerae TaxID=2358193 RepID=UPI000F0B6050|nr:hypothetical protein [Mycolicibacterium stellerae]
MAHPCFLVEWYRPEPGQEALAETAAKLNECAAAVSAEGAPVRLVTMFSVPPDEMSFALFTADSVDAVAQACGQAGIPPDRLTFAAGLGSPDDD